MNLWQCGEACTQLPGVTRYTPIIDESRGTFGFVAYNAKNDEIVISFRGTVNFQNWATNINFLQMTFPYANNGAQVHRGFYETYMAVEAQTMGALNQILAQHPNAKLVITGHSLGAALATFAAVHIRLQTKIPYQSITFYTYGSPRTGNQEWADFFYSLYPAG